MEFWIVIMFKGNGMKKKLIFWFVLLFYIMSSTRIFAYDVEVGGIYYNLNTSDMTAEVTNKISYYDADKYSGTISIPSSITYGGKNYIVTSIGPSSFSGCRELTSISLPNSIKVIGNSAFNQCDKLSTVSLSISLTTIESQAFYNCEALETIDLPDQISSIGNGAFWGCTSLKSVTIPNSLSSIEDYVFLGCGFISLELPQTVLSIGKGAFSSCKNLKELYLSNSLVSIGETAFSGCESLTAIVLPASLTSIGKDAFKSCRELNEVESKIKEPFETYAFSSYTSSFTGAPSNPVLYVPYGTKDKYLNCYGWGNFFKEVIERVGTHSLSITATGNGYASFDDATIRGTTSTFTVNEGASATISFTPDTGYRIKSVKVGGSINSITSDTTVEVEFEAITHTLTIKASGNGSASFDNTTIRSKTSTFTVNDGSSATISFTPDTGYRIKSVKVGGSSVTQSNNKYTISSITSDTTVEVEFEAITHTLTIKASGNGSASYDNTTIRSKTSTFTVNDGSSATISFTPDTGYRIKSVKVGGSSVTLSNNKYTINSITSDTTVEVEFEAITHTLTIKASFVRQYDYKEQNDHFHCE